MAVNEVRGLVATTEAREAPTPGDGRSVDNGAPAEPEVIRLTVPHEERFLNVARIVVGGLAARLDLPFESLDDLQLAVETVLAQPGYRAADEVTVEITVDGRLIAVDIGPLDTERVATDLAQTEDGFGLRVLLAAVVDSFRLDGADLPARHLRLEKQVPPAPAA
jgi:hypothetical protein